MSRVLTEYEESVKFHQWLQARQIPHTHIPNENGAKSGGRGAMNKRMGVSSGFPDYLVVIPINETRNSLNYQVPKKITIKSIESLLVWGSTNLGGSIECFPNRLIAIELKRVKKSLSKTSEAQKKWLEILNNAGIEAVVCYGADEAIKFIEGRRLEKKVEF